MENDARLDARLSPDWLSALASLATLIVVAITAYAAIRQMRHLRSANQVAALLPLIDQYRSPEMRESRAYAMRQLSGDLEDAETRAAVLQRPVQGPAVKAVPIANFYESSGALVNAKVIELELLLRYFALPSEIWGACEEFIALVRSTAGDEVFENFESLVAMEHVYAAKHGTSMYPKNLPRIPARLRDRTTSPGSLRAR